MIKKRDLLSIYDLDKKEILHLLSISRELKNLSICEKSKPQVRSFKELLRGRILASCFFEPSTRTRLSFESAMIRLGGSVIGFADAQVTSSKKGESLNDSMRVIGGYADIIVIRHPQEGSAHIAAKASGIPVVNAGDGPGEHPTQTLLDLFTIQETQGRLDNLHIALIGDLKYGRTTHSLARALSNFNCKISFVSPDSLRMPSKIIEELVTKGVDISFYNNLDEVVDQVDIIYMTRIQEERFSNKNEFDNVKGSMILTASQLTNVKSNLRILHPLPRVHEISDDVDHTPYSYYFEQAENGLFVRMALLAYLLGEIS